MQIQMIINLYCNIVIIMIPIANGKQYSAMFDFLCNSLKTAKKSNFLSGGLPLLVLTQSGHLSGIHRVSVV